MTAITVTHRDGRDSTEVRYPFGMSARATGVVMGDVPNRIICAVRRQGNPCETASAGVEWPRRGAKDMPGQAG
jgi:hypothetical protein